MTRSDELADLIALFDLEARDDDTFLGEARDPGWGQLYGGHVYAQALAAAQRTVEGDRPVHAHAGTFLLTGDVNVPITYVVDRMRDGRSFTSRRVTAYQRDEVIFHATTSFQVPQDGLDHQDPMPAVPPPEAVETEEQIFEALAAKLPPEFGDRLRQLPKPAFELRITPPLDDANRPTPLPPDRHVWLRTLGALPDDPRLHACLLAYVSDYYLLSTSLMPHGESWLSPRMRVATLNHALWFHERFRVDEWLLHTMHGPRSSHSRGLSQGAFYTRKGVRVATSTQEGLIRPRKRG